MSVVTTFSPVCDALPGGKAKSKRSGIFQRLLDRLIESRMRTAEAFLRQHSHLIPRELEERAAWRISERSEDSLPFVR
jgi:hypothetical protein